MFIKQVIVQGFKTYKGRTEIPPFDPRHNLIVGKNGSGKSNVFDAIQFVLSDKYSGLRPAERGRIWHEGSGDVSFASVEIVFDNSDGRFPEEEGEVSIRRAIGVKKDEYFLNRRQVPKTQIVSLLESAGLSRSNPYYVVQQGRVNELIKMGDNQRLSLLKEIAGTRTYETRRKESLKIMSNTQRKYNNVVEVVDFIDERLEELSGQKEELAQFQELDRERRCLEYAIYQKELVDTQERLRELEDAREAEQEQSQNVHENALEARTKRSKAEEECKVLRDEIAALHSSVRLLHTDRDQLLARRTQLELAINDASSRVNAGAQSRKRAETELAEVDSAIRDAEASLVGVAAEFSAKVAEEEQLQEQIALKEQRLGELYARETRNERFGGSKKKRDAFLKAEIAKERATLEAERQRLQNLIDGDQAQAEAQVHAEEEQVRTIEARLEEIRTLQANSDAEFKTLQDERDAATGERKEVQRELSELDSTGREHTKALKEAETTMLYTMDKELFRGLGAVRRIVQERGIDGYHGPLIELFNCDRIYNRCVEATAGNRLFHVVVDSDDTAQQIISVLNAERAGRVTFIPLAQLKQRFGDDGGDDDEDGDEAMEDADGGGRSRRIPKTSDAVMMIDKLRFAPEHRAAMAQVFGRTLIARDLEIAVKYAAQYRMDAITLDGDSVNRRGALTGGFTESLRSRLDAQRDIAAARKQHQGSAERIARLKAQEQQTEARVNAALVRMQELASQKTRLRNEYGQAATDLEAARKRGALARRALEQTQALVRSAKVSARTMEARLEGLQAELATPMRAELSEEEAAEIAECNTTLTELRKQHTSASGERSQLQVRKQALESTLQDNLLRRRDELAATIADAETADDGNVGQGAAALQARRRGQGRGRATIQEAVEAAAAAARDDSSVDWAARLDSHEHELRTVTQNLEETTAKLQAAEASVEQQRARFREVQATLDALKQKEAQEERFLAEKTKENERQLNSRTMLLQKKHDYERKMRDLGSLPKGHEKYMSRNVRSLLRALERCNEKLKGFTNVNRKAIEQYVGFSEKRTQLTVRKDELESGRESILELIEHLDHKKDEAIQRTFKEIAKHFTTVFSELVPEGRATLVIHRKSPQDLAAEAASQASQVDSESDSDSDEDMDSDDENIRKLRRKKSRGGASSANLAPTDLYTGIGIKVSFDGRPQNMKQLSGGQQTVVALALIFAIQRCDPSPFYLFDEIDSALDAEHRTAVAQMIHRQSGSAQFICTTFRSEMMATANRFYGVSFKNKVSQIGLIGREEARQLMQLVEREATA